MLKDLSFEIRSYGWQELAILYAPGITPRAATKRLTRWVLLNRELFDRLVQAGWKKGNHLLTPVQVRLIVDCFGEP